MKSVLIIEDDYATIRGLKDSFMQKGYEVSTAMNGEQAYQAIKKNRYALILLDIMLPKVNGFEICAHIRESEIDTPIIILTAKGEDEDVIRGLNLGADDYVAKPFSINQLHARANALLRRFEEKSVQIYHFADFTLNTNTRELLKNNKLIPLTPKEYVMLEFFLRKEGRAITRETLLNAVWQSSVITTRRSVDRCVNTLRKKIETDSKKPRFIVSVRDVGYKFLLCG